MQSKEGLVTRICTRFEKVRIKKSNYDYMTFVRGYQIMIDLYHTFSYSDYITFSLRCWNEEKEEFEYVYHIDTEDLSVEGFRQAVGKILEKYEQVSGVKLKN